jgi:hypothetical protein
LSGGSPGAVVIEYVGAQHVGEALLVGPDLVDEDAVVPGGDESVDCLHEGVGVGGAHDGVGDLLRPMAWAAARSVAGRLSSPSSVGGTTPWGHHSQA